jgi:hypothetical protein
MNLDARAEPKKHSIRLTLKNFTKEDLKLHGYVSSAPPSFRLPEMLSRSNEDAPNNYNFELSHDSNHGIWIRYRYVNNEVRGFDVRIHASFSKSQGIVMNTDIYYIDNQDEKKVLSREAIYTIHDVGGTTRCQVRDSTPNENIEKDNGLTFSAHIQYDIVNEDGWDLCASIEIQFLMRIKP